MVAIASPLLQLVPLYSSVAFTPFQPGEVFPPNINPAVCVPAVIPPISYLPVLILFPSVHAVPLYSSEFTVPGPGGVCPPA